MTETPRGRRFAHSEASEKQRNAGPEALTGSCRAAGVLLLIGAIGTVQCSVVGRFALGLSEDSGTVSFKAYFEHPFPIFLTYAGGMIAGVLFIIAAPLLYAREGSVRDLHLRMALVCQAMAGLILAVSASRWLIVLPFLEKQYYLPNTSAASRAAINVDYETISYFLGITLGEHLFALFTGLWIIMVAVHLLRSRPSKRWLGWLGLIAGAGWLLGSLEQLDFSQSQYFLVFLGAGPIIWLVWTAFLARELTWKRRDVVNFAVPDR